MLGFRRISQAFAVHTARQIVFSVWPARASQRQKCSLARLEKDALFYQTAQPFLPNVLAFFANARYPQYNERQRFSA